MFLFCVTHEKKTRGKSVTCDKEKGKITSKAIIFRSFIQFYNTYVVPECNINTAGSLTNKKNTDNEEHKEQRRR